MYTFDSFYNQNTTSIKRCLKSYNILQTIHSKFFRRINTQRPFPMTCFDYIYGSISGILRWKWSYLTSFHASMHFQFCILFSGCRSSATRFRWVQNYYQEQDEWALDDIYIGQQCPQMCRGHGWCDHGHCRSVVITCCRSESIDLHF